MATIIGIYDKNTKQDQQALKQVTGGDVGDKTGLHTESIPKALIIDDYSTASVTYFCKAAPGSLTADAVWQISIIDETGNYPIWKWADGNADFDNIADDRTTLNYS